MADKFFVKNEKSKSGEKVAKHNWAWFLGVIILILISISFVLPATGFLSNKERKINFGKYSDYSIDYKLEGEESYFAMLADRYSQAYSSMYSSGSNTPESDALIRSLAYTQAFDQAVRYYAYLDNADKSDLKIAEDEVNDDIIKQINSAGGFDADSWSSRPSNEREIIRKQVKNDLRVSHVQDDLNFIEDNKGNIDYISSNLGEKRSFKFLLLPSDTEESRLSSILDSLREGKSLEELIQGEEKVQELPNLYKNYKASAIYPSRSDSSDAQAVLNYFDSNADFADKLFSKDFSIATNLLEQVNLDDGRKLFISYVVNPEQNVYDSVQGRVDYLDNDIFLNQAKKSASFKDNFSSGYSKLFPATSS